MNSIIFLFFGTILTCHASPVVLWHGMGDSCCNSGSLGRIVKLLEKELPGETILSLKFGNDVFHDIESGYFLDTNKQVQIACDTIANNSDFEYGYHAIGFSQGGQFLRAVAQRCPEPPMKTLVTLGGQHQGVYGLPRCGEPTPAWCDYIRKLLNYGAYVGWIQKSLVQAQYWHDPLNEDEYKKYSLFIAEINNEKEEKNPDYAENLNKLEKLVLVKFNNDSMVTPRESSWFGFYAPLQAKEVVPYNETALYTDNLIGLKDLVENGKVEFLSLDGDHLQFSDSWFTDNIVPYLLG